MKGGGERAKKDKLYMVSTLEPEEISSNQRRKG